MDSAIAEQYDVSKLKPLGLNSRTHYVPLDKLLLRTAYIGS